jgi:hypothetical protein
VAVVVVVDVEDRGSGVEVVEGINVDPEGTVGKIDELKVAFIVDVKSVALKK